MASFRSRVQIVFSRFSRSRTWTIQEIPPEIVHMIFEILSIPDLICFSLSCKYTLTCLYSFLKKLAVPLHNLLPHEERPILSPNAQRKPIVQLLHQLENSRWKYCSECWNLHPRPKPPRGLLGMSINRSHKEPHCSNCLVLREQYICTPYTGEVDICPCLTITFRDKTRLIEACKRARESTHNGREYYFDNILYHSSYGKLQKELWHDCTFTDHPFTNVQVQTSFWIEGRTINLHVKNVYRFKLSEGIPSQVLSPSMKCLPCAHGDIGAWLGRFFTEAGSSFRGWGEKPPSRPSFLYWDDLERKRTRREPRPFEITVIRDLGNTAWPNMIWEGNCRS